MSRYDMDVGLVGLRAERGDGAEEFAGDVGVVVGCRRGVLWEV